MTILQTPIEYLQRYHMYDQSYGQSVGDNTAIVLDVVRRIAVGMLSSAIIPICTTLAPT